MIRAPLVRIVLYAILSVTLPAYAAVTPFTATHTYVLGDDDSRNAARQKCLAEAKRKILEQVGVYLESYSDLFTSTQTTTSGSGKSQVVPREERQQLTEQITSITAGLMRTEITKEEFGELNGRLQITLTVKADVDPDDVQKQLAARRADEGVRKQVTEQQQRMAYLEEQMRMMMERMGTVGGERHPESEQQGKDSTIPHLASVRERANQGDAEAQNTLGMMYYLGRGVPQSDSEAATWTRKAAEQGDASAQGKLGYLYQVGKGVPQNYTEAAMWTRKGAEQGDVPSQTLMGLMYKYGQGVPQNDTEAVVWFRKAADQGDARAQLGLGQMYALGRGVRHSDAEAVSWFRKGAENGSSGAQWLLGNKYFRGQGVSQNLVKAYMWANLAVVNGEPRAVQLRAEAAERMNPSQLAQAQAMVQKCQASYYKNCD